LRYTAYLRLSENASPFAWENDDKFYLKSVNVTSTSSDVVDFVIDSNVTDTEKMTLFAKSFEETSD